MTNGQELIPAERGTLAREEFGGRRQTRSQETPPQALQRILTAGKRQIEIAVGKAMDPDRMIRLAVSALYQSPGLGSCSMLSIANSVMLAAQLRLEIHTSLQHAWLIPYGTVCTFQPGYRGLIELAHRSDRVHDINAHLVWSLDEFLLEYGDTPKCVHKPKIGSDRGEWLGAYAHIRYKEGPSNALFMSAAEINDIRDKSSQSKNNEHGPWRKFTDEMRRKTAAKRLLKYVRLSVEDLARAVGLDDQAEAIGAQEPDGPRSHNPEKLQQENVLDAQMFEMAAEATHELKGSIERQQAVVAEKLAEVPKRGPGRPPKQQPEAGIALNSMNAPAQEPEPPKPPIPPELSEEEKLFNAIPIEGRRAVWNQLKNQLGQDRYQEIVNSNGGALNYKTYQDLNMALKSPRRDDDEPF